LEKSASSFPELIELVELSQRVAEDVYYHFAVVQKHPPRVGGAFMMVGEDTISFQYVFDFFLYSLNLTWGFGRANYEEVGKTVFAPSIK